MNRVTVTQLQAVIDRINRMTGSPAQPYRTGDDGRHYANVGNYHLSRAYGGYSLNRMVSDGGGVVSVFSCGHVPARALMSLMHAWISGYGCDPRFR